MAASTPALHLRTGGREGYTGRREGYMGGEGRVHGGRQCHRMFQQPRRETTQPILGTCDKDSKQTQFESTLTTSGLVLTQTIFMQINS